MSFVVILPGQRDHPLQFMGLPFQHWILRGLGASSKFSGFRLCCFVVLFARGNPAEVVMLHKLRVVLDFLRQIGGLNQVYGTVKHLLRDVEFLRFDHNISLA